MAHDCVPPALDYRHPITLHRLRMARYGMEERLEAGEPLACVAVSVRRQRWLELHRVLGMS